MSRASAIPVDGVLTGPEIEALDDDALLAAVTGVSIFARVSPEQKAGSSERSARPAPRWRSSATV